MGVWGTSFWKIGDIHPKGVRGGALLILHLLAFPFLRQSTFHIALHCTHPNYKIKKRNKIYSDSQQYPSKICLIKFVLNIHYLWLLYKSDSRISCFRNDGEMKVSKVHRTCHSINGGSLEITHVLQISIITLQRKKCFKSSLLPLTKSFIKKSLNQYCLQCKYIFDIIIYNTIYINPMK